MKGREGNATLMSRYVRNDDGTFGGSIGDGRERAPQSPAASLSDAVTSYLEAGRRETSEWKDNLDAVAAAWDRFEEAVRARAGADSSQARERVEQARERAESAARAAEESRARLITLIEETERRSRSPFGFTARKILRRNIEDNIRAAHGVSADPSRPVTRMDIAAWTRACAELGMNPHVALHAWPADRQAAVMARFSDRLTGWAGTGSAARAS